jgi:hypothetical protein
MKPKLDDIVRDCPALDPYARKTYQGMNDRRAKSFRQAWDFAAEFGGVLQTVKDVAARRIIAARLDQSEDPGLLPQHTRTLAIHYKSEGYWFIVFDDEASKENLAVQISHSYNSPAQYSAGWTYPLDGRVYQVLERAQEANRIVPHPAYDHGVAGTWFKAPLASGADNFEELAMSQALFGDLTVPFAQAHSMLGREALHYHLPRTDDLDTLVTSKKVLIVPVVVGGAYAVSPAIHLEKSAAMRDGIDTYLASAVP